MNKRPRSVGTHSGTFHADEVTACALLLLFDLVDEDKIIRTRDPALLADCEYVCDVGCLYDPSSKRFDHHQKEYNGLLSSAGMILHYLLETHTIDSNLYQLFNHRLIKGVDEHDNGRSPQLDGYCSFSHVISNFAPIAYGAGAKEQDAGFKEALHFVLGHLRRLHDRYLCFQKYREVMIEEMGRQESLLLFDQPLPWQDLFFELGGNEHPARFVVMPEDERGVHWKLRGVPCHDQDRMSVRQLLPQAWAGLSNHELEVASAISGAIFCHKGRFVSVWATKKAAIEAYEKAIEHKD